MSSRVAGWHPVKTTAPAVDAPTTFRKSRRVKPDVVASRSCGVSSLIWRKCPLFSAALLVTHGAFGRSTVLPVAIDAVTHVQGPNLHGLPHVDHIPMAGGEGKAGPEMRCMDESDEVRHGVEEDPVDRDLRDPGLPNLPHPV